MWNPRLLVFGLIVNSLILTGGFAHAASSLPMNQRLLDLDRSSDLVVQIKETQRHHDDDHHHHRHHHRHGDNNANQQGKPTKNDAGVVAPTVDANSPISIEPENENR